MNYNITLLLLSSLMLLQVSCDTDKNQIQENTMSTTFYIKAGISPAKYNQRNQLHPKKSIDKQPAGLNFYEQSWSTKQPGTVQVDNGDISFSIPYVLSSTGTEDTEYSERGIDEFSVNSGITADEFIDHDQARLKFMKTIQGIVALGWNPYIEYHAEPRLLGQQSFQHAVQRGSYSPDPLYTPTLDEWMALDSGHGWVFHAKDVFMKISFRRNSQFMKKNESGVYLLTFTLLTRDARARSYFQGEEREQWQSLWVEDMKKDKMMRYQSEVKLIKQGYHINTQYVEPVIHPQDPVEPEGEEAQALLDYIHKHNNQRASQ